jgi:hypothetical protein
VKGIDMKKRNTFALVVVDINPTAVGIAKGRVGGMGLHGLME